MRPPFKHFRDLTAHDVNFDFHMHTSQTDGRNRAEDMIAAARAKGLTAIGFSEHVNRTSSWYAGFVQQLSALRTDAGLRVLIGIEAKPLDFDGTIDASAEILDAAELIVGSVHRFPDGRGGLVPLDGVKALGAASALDIEMRLASGIVANRDSRIDVLGHPMGICTKTFGDFPEQEYRRLMEICRENDVAFEISTKYCPDLGRLVGLLRDVNPRVSVGSDAHGVEEVGRSFDQLRDEIARCH
ncbi:MAG TPA: PHP domain-containing protein [Gemmatimonadaceae bacterium]|nr:PHP domain-containing protein [Gemmatimonadaceae bacterium]